MAKSRSISEKHRIAREWAEAGFHVFPCLPNKKIPLITKADGGKGLYDATTDLAQIDAWWSACPEANIGCAPAASGHWVLDIDDKGDKHGSSTLRTIEQGNSRLPNTFTVTTPSGGRHLWFMGDEKSSVERLGEGLDVRGSGGYVLLPGSGVDGRSYDAVSNGEIVTAPAWITTLHTSRAHVREEALSEGTDEPGNIRRATKYLKDLVGRGAVAVSGTGGNALTYQTAAMLHDIGVSEDIAVDLLMEHWNDHCDPPWTEEELTDEIHSPVYHAYRYAENEAGSKGLRGDTTVFSGIVGADKPANANGDGDGRERREDGPGEFYPRDEGEQDNRPDPEWIVPGWFQKDSTVLLYGPPESFKSFAALDIALSFSSGKLPLGLSYGGCSGRPASGDHGQHAAQEAQEADGETSSGDGHGEGAGRVNGGHHVRRDPTREQPSLPTIYAAGEGAIGIERKRRPAWRAHRLLNGEIPFFSVSAVPLIRDVSSVTAFIRAIEARLDKGPDGYEKPGLIVLDTLSRMLAGMNENDAADASLAIEAIEAIKRAFGCMVIVIHHTGKDEKSERGSSVFRAGFDTLISCKSLKEQRLVTLQVTKQKDAETPGPITLKGHKVLDSLAFSPAKAEEVIVKETNEGPDVNAIVRQDVHAYLKDKKVRGLGEALTTRVLAHAVLDRRGELPADFAGQAQALRIMEKALRKLSKGPLAGYIISLPNTELMWALPD